jgi:hypothetical protein
MTFGVYFNFFLMPTLALSFEQLLHNDRFLTGLTKLIFKLRVILLFQIYKALQLIGLPLAAAKLIC